MDRLSMQSWALTPDSSRASRERARETPPLSNQFSNSPISYALSSLGVRKDMYPVIFWSNPFLFGSYGSRTQVIGAK